MITSGHLIGQLWGELPEARRVMLTRQPQPRRQALAARLENAGNSRGRSEVADPGHLLRRPRAAGGRIGQVPYLDLGPLAHAHDHRAVMQDQV